MQAVTYGYARVSSKDQCEARQMAALLAFPVDSSRIYMDKLSGKNFDRPQYQKLMRQIKPGDILVVKSIDRLGRDYEEILQQWRIITKEKRVQMVVLDMPLLDTRQTGKDLTGIFVADLVLQILSYVAQAERENIRQRQREGIAEAKRRGIRFGRPRKKIPPEFLDVKKEWEAKRITTRKAAQNLDVAPNTFLRWVEEEKSLPKKHKKVDFFGISVL